MERRWPRGSFHGIRATVFGAGALAACGGAARNSDAIQLRDASWAPAEHSDTRFTDSRADDSVVPAKRDSGTHADAPPDPTHRFDLCSISSGCVADCSPPSIDPVATGNPSYDLFDGCVLAGMQVAGMTQAWQGKLLKAQMYEESGLTPSIMSGFSCGGQNCGPWAISAGSISGDSPPGPCGSGAVDPATGQVDYSHSYGLFQSTPACDGVFALTTSLSGHTCTPTTTADLIPFGSGIYFYCESATSLSSGQHYIDAVQDVTSPLYSKSAFNPAYQIYVYFAQWSSQFAQANSATSGCSTIRQWYLTLAYWLTGNTETSCTLAAGSSGYDYVKNIVGDYQSPLFGTPFPYPFP